MGRMMTPDLAYVPFLISWDQKTPQCASMTVGFISRTTLTTVAMRAGTAATGHDAHNNWPD